MVWVKLDDGFFENPKIMPLSKDAKLLYLAGLTYCAKQLTDGVLTVPAVRICKALSDTSEKAAQELIAAGRWEPHPDGWFIHDWEEYNPPAAKVRADRDAAKDRMKAIRSYRHSGERTGEQTGELYIEHSGERTDEVRQLPYPVSPMAKEDPDPQDKPGGANGTARASPGGRGWENELVTEFAPQLGGEQGVRDALQLAKGWLTGRSWNRRRLHEWLEGDVERRNGHGTGDTKQVGAGSARTPGDVSVEQYRAEYGL